MNPLDVRAGVPTATKKMNYIHGDNGSRNPESIIFGDGLPIRMPPGIMADTSPGTVFLLAAI